MSPQPQERTNSASRSMDSTQGRTRRRIEDVSAVLLVLGPQLILPFPRCNHKLLAVLQLSVAQEGRTRGSDTLDVKATRGKTSNHGFRRFTVRSFLIYQTTSTLNQHRP